MLTYYYVLRLLNSKQIPMSRDFYISPLLQFNIAVSNMSKNDAINLINEKLKQFCDKINIPTIILQYNGVEGYSEKVYMVAALNQKSETQTIIQSSLLSKELLNKFDVSEDLKNKFVFDIGYSQKIFAYLACNNMDSFGMRMPSIYQQKDIAIINKGVRIILVQNYLNNKELFLKYDISKKMCKLFTIEEIYGIIKYVQFDLDNFYYKQMNDKIEKYRIKEYAYVSEFKDKGKIIN